MRLASLFGPDAIAQAPRADALRDGRRGPRRGRPAAPLTRAIAEIERLPDAARTPGVAASYDEVTADGQSRRRARNRSRAGFAASMWKMDDRSETGCRLTAPAKEAPGEAGRDPRDQGRRHLGARRRAPDAAAPGRRDHGRRRDHRPAAGARAAAQLGDARRRRPRRRRPAVLRHLPAGASGEPADGAAQPDRPRRAVRHRRHGRARHRQRALPDPLHADARAAGRLGLDAVHRRCASSRPDRARRRQPRLPPIGAANPLAAGAELG